MSSAASYMSQVTQLIMAGFKSKSFMPTVAAHGNHLGPFIRISVRASPTFILITLVRCGALLSCTASSGSLALLCLPLCGHSFPGHFFRYLSHPVSYSSFLIPFSKRNSARREPDLEGTEVPTASGWRALSGGRESWASAPLLL